MKSNLLKDALYYTHPDSGASTDHGKGVVTGMVSTIMALQNVHFVDAFAIVKDNLPAGYRIDAIPPAWQDQLEE